MTGMLRLLQMGGPLKVDIEFIKSQLNLPNKTSAETFREACGFYYIEDPRYPGSGRETLKRGQREAYMETFKKWRQDGPLIDHDRLRGSMRRSSLIQHGLKAFQYDQE